MQRFPKKPVTAIAVALALLSAVPLAGCSMLGGSGQGYLVFDSKQDAADQGSKDVPAWVPDDATSITVEFPAKGPGYLMKFHSAHGVPASGACTAVSGDAPLAPTISAGWWPDKPLTADRRDCGSSQVARFAGTWYAWVKTS